jgi:hypothetical protein
VPTRHWHWDNLSELHLDRPRALFVVSFVGSVAPRSGGTLILSGSPRLLTQQERQIPASQRLGSITTLRERFHRSHPWLMALTGQAPSPADRIAEFMDQETIVDGAPLRVVELTGEPGGHGLLPSRHGPLRCSEPGHVAALHADQDADPHPRGRELESRLERERSTVP